MRAASGDGEAARPARRGRAGRTLAAAAVLAVLAVLALGAFLAHAPSRTQALNASLAALGVEASADDTVLSVDPPRAELHQVRLRRSFPDMEVDIRAARCVFERRDAPGGSHWLVRVESPRVSVTLTGRKASEGPRERPPQPPMALGSLRVLVSDGAMRLALPQGEAWASGLSLDAASTGAFSLTSRCGAMIRTGLKAPDTVRAESDIALDGNFDLDARSLRAAFRLERGEASAAWLRASLAASGEADVAEDAVRVTGLVLDVPALAVEDAPRDVPEVAARALAALPGGLTARLKASGSFSGGRAALEVDSLAVPGLLDASGSLTAGEGGRPQVALRASVADAALLTPLAAAFAPGWPADLSLSGPVELRAAMDPDREGLAGLSGTARMPGLAVSCPSLGVSGVVSAEASRTESGLAASVSVLGALDRPGLRLPEARVQATLAGEPGAGARGLDLPRALRLERLSVSVPAGTAVHDMVLPALEAGGEGLFDLSDGLPSGRLNLRGRLAGVGEAEAVLGLGRPVPVRKAPGQETRDRKSPVRKSPDHEAQGSKAPGREPSERGAPVPAVLEWVRLESARAEVSLPGLARLTPRSVQALKPAGVCRLEAKQEADSQTLDVTGALRSLALDLPGDAKARGVGASFQVRLHPGATPRVDLSADAGSGLLEGQGRRVDLARLPLRLQGEASIEQDGGRIGLDARASLAKMLILRVRGALARARSGWTPSLEARAEVADIAQAAMLAAPPGTALPRLAGRAELKFRLNGGFAPADLTGAGAVDLASLEVPQGVTAKDLRIPVVLEKGLLRLWDERSPRLSLGVLGGVLEIEHPEVRDPFGQGFAASASATLRDVPLKGLTRGRVDAPLSGHWPKVTLTREMLTLDGELAAEAFGGRAVVKGVMVAKPLEKDRQVRLHAGLLGADLERLSAMTGGGRVTGRVNVTLSEFRVAGFLPLSFTLRVETVETPGVEQRISLGAVNSLTEVSAGRAVDPGFAARTALKLFGDFGYRKLGLMVGLKGKWCTVRGLHHENGVEYVLRRSGFTGVDVVIGNAENAIPFADLLARILNIINKRIETKVRFELPHPPAPPGKAAGPEGNVPKARE
ncbi:hypothetical protein NNJEOMEG_00378 [Fundidesulfovibrio magnetotacticus]|uniref:Uncharacterized protein n=1 Tax=Fundidesulfovibrio magnetotacticus TaxID=2730080 RepID=A0A6V8LIL2_9BACT|nr:hypothetical protein [Fundidesulfovibrio magnetotacticus]GFK92553.1 hypothetical protein NNJEOMEG_00378 [Fundidesulfovibrio magnetotacticus]